MSPLPNFPSTRGIFIYQRIEAGSDMAIPESAPKKIIYIAKGELLAPGSTAFLERLPPDDVVKTPTPDPCYPPIEYRLQSMRVEAQIYERIGPHPRIPKFIDWDSSTCCLTIEFLEKGPLDEFITGKYPETITPSLRRQWANQAAEGVRLLHSHGVIADFAGSSILGAEPSAFQETRFRHPICEEDDHLPRFEDDIFGLGSLIYFTMTGAYPYGDVSSDEVRDLFQDSQFRDVGHIAYGSLIEHCWQLHLDADQAYEYFG